MGYARNVGAVAAVTMLVAFGGGCGGSEAEVAAEPADSVSQAARKGGGATPAPAVVLTAAPSLIDRDAPFTISLYPGGYAGQKLFVKWQCYQGEAMNAYDGSYELNQASSQGVEGYANAGDHFEWTFTLSRSWNYHLADGPAACVMQAWYQNRKLQWFQIGSGAFDVQ